MVQGVRESCVGDFPHPSGAWRQLRGWTSGCRSRLKGRVGLSTKGTVRQTSRVPGIAWASMNTHTDKT